MSLATDINGIRDWIIEARLTGLKDGDLVAIADNLKDVSRRAAALELAAVPDAARREATRDGGSLHLVHAAEAVPQGGVA